MEEATRDKQSSTSEPKRDKQKTSGWIRMHSDAKEKPPPSDEQLDDEFQSRDRKIRKAPVKP